LAEVIVVIHDQHVDGKFAHGMPLR
jgi:hypothetical protein